MQKNIRIVLLFVYVKCESNIAILRQQYYSVGRQGGPIIFRRLNSAQKRGLLDRVTAVTNSPVHGDQTTEVMIGQEQRPASRIFSHYYNLK